MVNNAAGNTTTRSRTFTVTLDADSLKQMVMIFLGSGGPGNNGIINAMHQQIDNDSLNGFTGLVEAQCCTPEKKKRLTQPQHDVLVGLATQLLG